MGHPGIDYSIHLSNWRPPRKNCKQRDFMIISASGWSLMRGEMDPALYYKLDGTNAITSPFAGGNNQYKNMADGTDEQDGVNKRQLQAGLSGKADVSHQHSISDVTNLQTELDNRATDSELTTVDTKIEDHSIDASNPHSVTKSQVGLGNVDNTSDLDKPISTDTQTALDTKEDFLGNPVSDSGYFLTSDSSGLRTWEKIGIVEWGDITGDITNQSDLLDLLSNNYSPINHSHMQYLKKSGDTMTGNLIVSTEDAQRVIFERNIGNVSGAVYHSDATDQVVLARYAADGTTIESQVVLGEECPFITGVGGGYPNIQFDSDLVTKK